MSRLNDQSKGSAVIIKSNLPPIQIAGTLPSRVLYSDFYFFWIAILLLYQLLASADNVFTHPG